MRLPGTSRAAAAAAAAAAALARKSSASAASVAATADLTVGASVAAAALKPWQAGYTEQEKALTKQTGGRGSASYGGLEAARDAQSAGSSILVHWSNSPI